MNDPFYNVVSPFSIVSHFHKSSKNKVHVVDSLQSETEIQKL
jgi:hypothetical protein